MYGTNRNRLPQTWGVKASGGVGDIKNGKVCHCPNRPGPQTGCKKDC